MKPTGPSIGGPQRIAITGGAGYIGRATVRRLLEAGHQVRVVDLAEAELPDSVDQREIDVRDGAALTEALNGCDALVHLAGLVAAEADGDPDKARSINEEGTRTALQACRDAGVTSAVFASTFLVYTGATEETMDEDCAIDGEALEPFASSKLAGERIVAEWGAEESNNFVALRIGSVYGPGGGSNVVRTFIEDALAGREVEVWGMGRRMRPLIFVGDVAAAIERAVSHLCAGGASGLFNCVGPRSHSTREILDGIQAVLPGMQVTYLSEKPEPVGDVCPSTARARRVLAWQADTELEDGIAQTVDWFREQRNELAAAGGGEIE